MYKKSVKMGRSGRLGARRIVASAPMKALWTKFACADSPCASELRRNTTGLKMGEHTSEKKGVGITFGQRPPDFAHGPPNLCANFEQLQPDGPALCFLQFGARQRGPPQRL